jgi:hypothetical protein
VYVFKAHGGYVAYHDRHVDLADPVVLHATEVAVVQLRPWQLAVDLAIPSLNVRDTFTVRTSFRCRVVDAAEVARAGLVDLDVLLRSHLWEHDGLGTLGQPYSTAAVHEVRRLADAEIKAYWMVAPLDVAGMEIGLSQVDVLPVEKAPMFAPNPMVDVE